LLKKGEGRGEREENPQIMEEKCGEPLDIADERERETLRRQHGESQCYSV
jgi:hypothetical protein